MRRNRKNGVVKDCCAGIQKFAVILRQFCNLWCPIYWLTPDSPKISFVRHRGLSQRGICNCEMNVGTCRGTQTLILWIFALPMQFNAFWSHNFSRFLAKNKLQGVLNLFNIIFNQKMNFDMSNNVIKKFGFHEILDFWLSLGPMVW